MSPFRARGFFALTMLACATFLSAQSPGDPPPANEKLVKHVNWFVPAEVWDIQTHPRLSHFRPKNINYTAYSAVGFNLANTIAIIGPTKEIVIIDTLGEDFISAARAKGLKESVVVLKHALAHSLIPVLTVMGPLTATLLTGSFVVEYVFAIPGMGRFFITAVTNRDYPLVMGVTLVYTALLFLANVVVDMLYGLIDPRVRTE